MPVVTTYPNHASSIPIELGRMILRSAVDSDGALDTSVIPPLEVLTRDPSFSLSYARHDLSINDSGLSRNIRRKMGFVSKRFRAIAKDIIYEHIRISFFGSLKRFERFLTLEARRCKDGQEGERPAGTFVKRLDYKRYSYAETKENPLLHSIIRLCPNLEVLNMYVDESWDGSNPLSETTISFDSGFGRRLRHLRWDEALMGSCIPFLPILHQFGIIEALILSLKVGEFPGTLCLPRLHTLEAMGDSLSLRPFIVAATSWSLPALAHVTLSLDGEPGDAISSTDLNPFLDAFGPNILFLALRLEPDLRYVLAACPALQHLVLTINGNTFPAQLNPVGCDHHSLVRVTIDAEWGPEILSPDEWEQILQEHMNFFLKMHRPALRYLRYIIFSRQTTSYRDLGMWRRWMKRFAEDGIRFEDGFGNLLKFPEDTRNNRSLFEDEDDEDVGVGAAGEDESDSEVASSDDSEGEE
jgi:hypothetical protein